ncbi:DUF4850 domain-containing protein [Dyella sp. ASV21]|jgi:hypothetical protein|uniref:DUF4850 domain-containing protein n=1 Tax=Dyella sp. ASV21 TaxID=2795114 RepID=UPI0018ED0B98|nr:DUF4850 domain-containing protein [Dyella sp. ASV21]
MRVLDCPWLRWLGAGLLAVCVPLLHAETGVRELPSTPELTSALGKDYALRTAQVGAHTVTLIDVNSGLGDWLRPDSAKLPTLPLDAPAALHDRVQWFYGNTVGWMPVPAGWHVQRAAIGVDGGAVYTFAAAAGASSGWLSYTVVPACLGCMLEVANGLLPGAGEHLADVSGGAAANLGQTNPVMSWQSRPDDCTALFRYRAAGLTVQAAVLSSIPVNALDSPKGDLAVAAVYAALPGGKPDLSAFVIDSFRQAFPACHSPQGWPG